MPRNFEIRRRGKPGSLPVVVGEQRDDGTCTAIVAGNGHEAATVDELVAAAAPLSSTGVDLIWAD